MTFIKKNKTETQKTNKNRLIRGTALAVCIAALGIGAISYFTDYKSADTTQTHAGTVEATLDLQTKDLDGALGIINPGDVTPFNFVITNTGEKSIDVKPVITIKSDRAMNPDDMEFKLVKENKADGTETLIDTVGKVVMSEGNKVATYTITDSPLAGSVEKDQSTDGATENSKTYNYYFAFDEDAKNNMQGATLDVSVEMFAKQHRNTETDHAKDSDWTSIVEEKVN